MSNHTYDADMLDKLLADLINYKVFGDDERFVNINYIYHRIKEARVYNCVTDGALDIPYPKEAIEHLVGSREYGINATIEPEESEAITGYIIELERKIQKLEGEVKE
mgnify:CR=1 FL=1